MRVRVGEGKEVMGSVCALISMRDNQMFFSFYIYLVSECGFVVLGYGLV